MRIGISSQKFGSLLSRAGDKFKTGTYEVRISDFVGEYSDVILQELFSRKPDANAVLNELKKALSASQQTYEVGVTNEDWSKYLEQREISVPGLQQRSPAGRRPKASWHHLVPIIAGYLMTLDKRPSDSKDHLYIATKIHELASKAGIMDLPAIETIRDVISRAFAQAEKLSGS